MRSRETRAQLQLLARPSAICRNWSTMAICTPTSICWMIWEGRRKRLIRRTMLRMKSIAMLSAALLALVVAVAPWALAQSQNKWGEQHGHKMKGPGPHRGEWLRKHQDLPLSEQEKALQNDPSFKQLTPDKQQQLLQRLRDFNNRPPEQRQRMLERMEPFEHLPQPERQQLRSLYGQMRDLPQERRVAVRQAARQLSGMSPADREGVLNSVQFQQRFSPQEQNLVRGLLGLEPGQTSRQ